ncbi:hypothetical protein HJFPF1_08052 [Paramyrothecium foliicola]|nr:hypothetical protein HJFPF1_08052 [Paramyrothecium foliicola]
MCLSFVTNSTCPECSNLFRRRRTSVPCWNGSLSPWRIHRHGLSCRSSRYDRGPDEVRTDELCSGCAAARTRRRQSIRVMTTAAAPPPYTYRHSYISTADASPYRNSIDGISTSNLIDAGVSRHACAANRARYSMPPNAWAGCAPVQVDGPRTRWCH